jgi:V/A-type H+-transporting ATPase subunit B
MYSAYTYVKRVETLASIIGESELSDLDKKYLEFGRQFELRFVQQGITENRSIEDTLDLAWELASSLPRRELTRVTEEQIDMYGQGV